VPQIANAHPSLLYALLSISALHLSRLEPEDLQLQTAHRTYHVLALQDHRFAINKLGDAKSADATCFTSTLIFINAYAALQDRVVEEPYEPPMQWLQVSNGARNIFQIALQSVQYDPTAVVNTFTKSMPAFLDLPGLFQSSHGAEFSNLLLPVKRGSVSDDLQDEAELQNEETREAYTNTITYLGSVHMAIKRKEHTQEICRWLMAFAVVIPRKMIWLIEAKRPRAFIILAHYFALVGSQGGAMEAVWWIGRIARREIEAIQKYLPDEWQHLMSWPLAMTKAATTAAD
jgi:Fungal specific transcription factor domain